MSECECQHIIIRFALIRDEVKPLEYGDSEGNLIDPEWLTITHNRLGVDCHGGIEGYTMEYRRNDGSVITWEEFKSIDSVIETATRWYTVSPSEWLVCVVTDPDNARPWATEVQR